MRRKFESINKACFPIYAKQPQSDYELANAVNSIDSLCNNYHTITSNQTIEIDGHFSDHNSHVHTAASSSTVPSTHLHSGLVSTTSPSSAFLLNEETPLGSFSQELNADICLTSGDPNPLELYQIDTANTISGVQTIASDGQPIAPCLLNNDSRDLCWNSFLADDIPLVEAPVSYSMVTNQSTISTLSPTNPSSVSITSLSSPVRALNTDSAATGGANVTCATTDSVGKSLPSNSIRTVCSTDLNSKSIKSADHMESIDWTTASATDEIASINWSNPNEESAMIKSERSTTFDGNSTSTTTTLSTSTNGGSTSSSNGLNTVSSNWVAGDCKVTFEPTNAFDLDNFAELEQCTNY